MDAEKVLQDLNRRFAEPLPEFYQRRIIFWYDEEQEFADKLDDIEMAQAKFVRLTGTNNFETKKLLSHDDLYSNYLVYVPYAIDDLEDDWLLDLRLFSEEFRADLLSIWMTEMRVAQTIELRKTVKHYSKFFGNKERRAKIAAAEDVISAPAQLHLAVMAAITGAKKRTPGDVLQAVLTGELRGDAPYDALVAYGAKDAFWQLVARGTGYNDEEPTMQALMVHLLLTACTRTMHEDVLDGLEQRYSTAHQAWCYDFVSQWLHSDGKGDFRAMAEYVEGEMQLYKRFLRAFEHIQDTELFPCIDECILAHLMAEIASQTAQVELIRKTVDKRRASAWYEDYALYYEGIQQIANMMEFHHENAAGFHIPEPQKLWKKYTEELYRMDTYYRRFHLCFNRATKEYHPVLSDLFSQVKDTAEALYSHWFLVELGASWTNASEDQLADTGRLLDVPHQTMFYQNQVKPGNAKTFVIISDAMRYEVAAELAETLRQETQGQVELSSMQGIFPTMTHFGMAALLPHSSLTVEKNGDVLNVLADGMLTGSANRGKVLCAANANSVALQYKQLIGMKRAERTALVKGMGVVYIYHDAIDSASHTADSMVFPACSEAIDEIKAMIRIIVNEFSGTNILITADHGFLYTASPLQEDDKVSKADFIDDAVEYGRRYAITTQDADPTYLMPVHFLRGKTPYQAYAPRENVRIRKNGGGMNFVHGGASLQEMVVPVIRYHHLRNTSKEYQNDPDKYTTKPVSVKLLSASRKISNMIFSLNFHQEEAVGGNRAACTYLVQFVDEYGNPVSDTQKIVADKNQADAQDRRFRCTFNLRAIKYDRTKPYYLIISSENGLQIPQREEFHIDIAFSADEFNFF